MPRIIEAEVVEFSRRIVRGFDTLKRSDTDKYVDQVVTQCFRDTYYANPGFAAIDLALSLITGRDAVSGPITKPDKDLGVAILELAENYFRVNTQTYKLLVAADIDAENPAIDPGLRKTAENINQKLNLAERKGLVDSHDMPLLIQFIRGLEDKVVKNATGLISVIDQPLLVLNQPNYEIQDEAYSATIDTIFGAFTAGFFTRVAAAEKLMGKLQQAASFPCEGLPDLWTTKYGGVCLADIFSSTSISETGTNLLRFAANLPPGHFVWQRLVQEIFFVVPQKGDDFAVPAKPSNPYFLTMVLGAQEWLAKHLFLPAYYPSIANVEFDELFAQMVSRLDALPLAQLIDALRNIPVQLERMGDLLVFDNPHNELFAAGHDAAKFPKSHFVVIDQVIHNLLSARIVSDSLHDRLGPYLGKNGRFFKLFESATNFNFEQKMAQDLEATVTKRLGDNFFDRLAANSEQLLLVTQEMWQVLAEKVMAYWPHPHTSHEITFSKDSLPKLMGFASVQFAVGEDANSAISFCLNADDSRLPVVGTMNSFGEITDASADLSVLTTEMKVLMGHILTASFHDLLFKEVVVRDRRSRQIRAGGTSQTDQRSGPRRSLPRRQVFYNSGVSRAGQEVMVESDDLADEIHEHVSQRVYTPRSVDLHIRHVEGGADYETLLGQLESCPPELKSELQYQLGLIRKRMKQPSADKLEKLDRLPAGFQLPAVIDSDTGVKLYLYTWVKPFLSPKPPDDNSPATTLLQFYEKRYRAGSAFSFLDLLKVWIIGEDIQSVS